MRFFKLIRDSESDSNANMCKIIGAEGLNEYTFFDSLPDSVYAEYDTSDGVSFSDYVTANLPLFIITSKFKSLFEKFTVQEILYIPIKAIEKNIRTETILYVANIKTVLDALDLSKSMYSYFKYGSDKQYLSVIKYGLKRSIVKDHRIFRLKDGVLDTIFVREDIKEAIIKEKITGCDFVEVRT